MPSRPDAEAQSAAPLTQGAPRPTPPGLQGFVACPLAAPRLSAPFFFCLGFLASRLDRFCSLFATMRSRQVSRRRICSGCASMQPMIFGRNPTGPPPSDCRRRRRPFSAGRSAPHSGRRRLRFEIYSFLQCSCARLPRADVQEERSNSSIRDDRLGCGQLAARAGLPELLDHQPSPTNDFDPPAQCSMGSRGPERRDLFPFLAPQSSNHQVSSRPSVVSKYPATSMALVVPSASRSTRRCGGSKHG